MLIFNFHLVKKKSGAGLKLSTLMNIGKKKILSLEGPETCVETSGRLIQACCRCYLVSTVINIKQNCRQINISTFFFITGYLNVLVNSQWRTRWCQVKNGKLWFFQDKGKSKVSQQPVPLEGCMVLPDPSPEHLYSFRIQMDKEELATLEVILISYLVG